MRTSPESHCAQAECKVPAQQAFAFLADGRRLGEWALGAWDVIPAGEGVWRGRSLFDDQSSWVRPVADAERLCVTYHVGADPASLTPRIVAQVDDLGADADGRAGCRIGLHATRGAGMDDARWLRLVRCHEVEVLLILGRLALDADRRAG